MIVFRRYELVDIDVNKLVILPQVRKTKNGKLEEIVDSIKDKGLINEINIARLTYDELLRHIEFTNALWKKNVKIDGFEMIDEYYYVVIAGHTRVEAAKIIAKEEGIPPIPCKIHEVHSSREMLAIQLDENIHSEPPIEERAIAIIESYRIGLITGEWRDKAEFIQKNKNKFSRRVLNDAIEFANLPVYVQEYIFSGNTPYAVGVELGKVFPLMVKYESCFTDDISSVIRNVEKHYGIILLKLQHAKSIKQSLQIIRGEVKHMDDYFRPKEDVQQEMLFEWNNGVDIQSELRERELQLEHQREIQTLNRKPTESFLRLLTLDTMLTHTDHSEDSAYVKALFGQYMQLRFKR